MPPKVEKKDGPAKVKPVKPNEEPFDAEEHEVISR